MDLWRIGIWIVHARENDIIAREAVLVRGVEGLKAAQELGSYGLNFSCGVLVAL